LVQRILNMAIKSLDKEITSQLHLLSTRQKQTVLTVVKNFTEEKKDWWDEMGAAQQTSVDKALAEMKAGKLTPHETVMKKYKKWLKK
jgi:predicted transcriptional regulator